MQQNTIEEALNAIKFLDWLKKFGLALNILGPVKGQGISKIGFCAGTKVFEEALNAIKFLYWLKKFGPPQNILGLVKGQGICPFKFQESKNRL